jgi:hypothetical protein
MFDEMEYLNLEGNMKKTIPIMTVIALCLFTFPAIAEDGGGSTNAKSDNAATPAEPGGGNENAKSDNAATPATPAKLANGWQGQPTVPASRARGAEPRANEAGFADMDDGARNAFCEGHQDLQEEARRNWDEMTAQQREEFRRAHPRLARRMFQRRWSEMTPEMRGAFLEAHPVIRERLAERWEAMSSGQRRDFCRNHPRMTARMRARLRSGGNQGVRDHGAGRGRDGVGQGGERRGGNQGVRDHGAGQGRGGAGQGGGPKR